MIEKVEFHGIVHYYNSKTLKYFTLNKCETYDDNYVKEKLLYFGVDDNSIGSKITLKQVVSNSEIIYLTVNLSKNCNMKCKYCFRNDLKLDTYNNITIDDIKVFIEQMKRRFINAKHFHIDLTGEGEPLIRFNLMKEIIYYTKSISSDDLKFQVGFCTNGTLLTKEMISYFEDNKIYYGISVDGDKRAHDTFRTYQNNLGTYNDIMRNIRSANKEYVGSATTLTNESNNLVKVVKRLNKYFDSIAMKPIRSNDDSCGAISQKHISKLKKEYTELYNFLLNQTLKMNTWYIFKLIRSEDYFGRYLKRVLLNQVAITRCNAGISRFSLDYDKNIYVCGAANKISKFKVGKLGSDVLNDSLLNELYDQQHNVNFCKECWARGICGGMCMIELYNLDNSKIRPLCELTRHIILLALSFKKTMQKKNHNLYQELVNLSCDNHYV
jgi:uncharacterized protein